MTLPSSMTAIAIRAPGGPEMLVPEERPVPQPGPGEVVVHVRAAALNRGEFNPRYLPDGGEKIGGHEAAGEVAAVGEGVIYVKAGDRVLFGKWSGSEVKIDGEELLIMKESDILGIVG